MKKKLYYLLITELIVFALFLLGSCQPDSNQKETTSEDLPERGPSVEVLTVDQPFIRRYQGLIDRKEVIVVLINWGDGRLGGWLSYGADGKRKSLDGEVNLDEGFLLEIFDEMEFEGRIRGSLATIEDLQGQWSNPDSTMVYPFSVQLMPVQEDRFGWRGVWHLNDTWDGGTLLIGDIQRSTFMMALEINRNGHYGYLEQEVAYLNTKATIDQPLFSEGENCQLVLGKQTHQVQLYQPSTPASCGFGARASASGVYERQQKSIPASLSYGDDRSHFPSKAIHDNFRTIIGKEAYDQYAFNMQKYVREEKVQLNAKQEVKSVKGWVAGMMTAHEAIVLYDGQGTFWSARIEYVDETTAQVIYQTNDGSWKKQLPVAIEKWRSRFQEYPVIYP